MVPERDMQANPGRRLPAFLGLTLAYIITGALGLLLAVPPGYATAIFPPAGLAIAAAFIGGPATLPWIFLGSALLNLYVGTSSLHELTAAAAAAVAAVIALASALQAALAGWVLRRLLGYPAALDHWRDLARFLLLTPVLCLTSASLSLAGMWALGAVEPGDLPTSWLTWWIGDTLGVLVVFPLVMVAAGEPREAWRKRAWPVALPMALFFALFVVIFIKVSAVENEQSLLEFRLLSQRIADRIQERLGRQQIFLEQLERSFAAKSTPVSRETFRALVRDLPQRLPAVQAVEWAPRISKAERPAFEALQQKEMPGFAVRERTASGALRPAGDRDAFYPVTYVEPLDGNREAMGFDLASDAARRTTIERAVESGTVVATAPIALVQAPHEAGSLLTLAVPDAPNGPGIVLLALRMGVFMGSVLGDASDEIGLQLVDRESGLSLFDSPTSTSGKPLSEQSFTFSGRTYVVRSAPTQAYLRHHRGWQSPAVLMAGVLSTGLLGALLMLGTGERRRFEALLEDRTRERDRIWQVSEDLLGVGNFEGYFISLNPAWTRVLGWSEDEIRSMHVDVLRHPDDLPIGVEGRKRLAAGVPTVRMENRFRCKDGSYRWIYWTMTAEKGLIYLIGRDINAEKAAAATLRRAEEQLRQSQKMQALGQLTGGIAHDFNNLLTIIIGGLEIVDRDTVGGARRVRTMVSAAMTGALRAATLTQRLLAYAQKQPLNPRFVDLNQLIISMADLIRQTHGESIGCDFALGEDVGSCFCDPSQLETAVLNLVINARDAMPSGGKLEIATAATSIDEASVSEELPSGQYLKLSVSDTGSGMSPETRAQAFEPFFTTKGPGKGTGLGLSMVYGFVRQSHGLVEIESELGRGTTVRILLPSVAPTAVAGPVAPALAAPRGRLATNAETILLVEDDEQVRDYIAEILRDLGYRVVVAESADSAIEGLAQVGEGIDLLLTDVMLPGMNGRDLAAKAKNIRPGIKTLFMTGYARDVIVHQGRLDPGIELIEKPFKQETLAARIRMILDQGVGSAPDPSPVTQPT
jgi:PAS domain S-box-containing protein